MSEFVNKLNNNDYEFIKTIGFPDDDIIIIEQEAEIMEAKPTKTKAEKVALEYRRQLHKIFTHIDYRIAEIEDLDNIDFSKKAILLKELNRIKNRFNP